MFNTFSKHFGVTMEKVLNISEVKRVCDLNQVWQYLYWMQQYALCDVISKEIGIIKDVEV